MTMQRVIANEERVKQSVTRIAFFVLFLIHPILSYAQQKLEILHAGSLKFDENLGNGAKRLIGDVQFKHDNVLMFCDSAYFYSDNSLDAFGHIHIQQADSIHLFGELLNYSGNTKKAIVSKNVIVNKGDMQLTTDVLNYDMATSIGYYTTGAKIINKENELTSNQGYFFAKTNELNFKKNVVLTNQKPGQKEPQLVINCDTMRYNTTSKITYFAGPTTIKSKTNLIYCEDGWYDTKNDLSRFSKNAYIQTEEQKMFGDSLYYDRIKGIGRVIKNVQIIDTTQHLTIKGDYAIHYELIDLSIVTGKTLLTQISGKDTLYVHADTLKALGSQKTEDRRQKVERGSEKPEDRSQEVFAYHKVKFFKNDLQGKCDSLVYTLSDSIMKMYGTPTIWSEENQLTADYIEILTGEKSLRSIELKGSAFIVSQEDSVHYNQIRGKTMKGFFIKNELYLIKVEGNGQTIYYAEEKKVLKAVNRADCSDLNIYLKDEKIDRIHFITKPEATLYPLDQIDVKELKLKDFSWREHLRPHKIEDIFLW